MTSARGQEGFSLIELLMAMAIITVVVMATISAFVAFHKNERVNRLANESQDEARLTLERLSSQLRNLASPNDFEPYSVEKAEPYDLVFRTVDAVKPVGSLNARNIKRVRYCVGPVSGAKAPLIRQQQTWQVVDPPPSYSTASCTTTGAGGWEKTQVVASDVVNTELSPPAPIFKYTPGPAPLDDISAIRADLTVDVNPGTSPSAVSLGTGVYLRNQNRRPVASCTTPIYAGTGGQVALNGSGSEDPEGFNLKDYQWFVDGKETQVPKPGPDATGVVAIWNGTPGTTHSFVLEVHDQGGLSAQASCGSVTIPNA
jgi:prepilin-type N-terminal cleavage/methylation domain-containing protein